MHRCLKTMLQSGLQWKRRDASEEDIGEGDEPAAAEIVDGPQIVEPEQVSRYRISFFRRRTLRTVYCTGCSRRVGVPDTRTC